MARFYPEELVRLRSIDATKALQALADHAKRDLTFQPAKAKGTERWHATASGREYEFLLSGPKFFDTRLAIYLYRVSFNDAISLLRQRGL